MMNKAERVLIEWLKECDSDGFCAVFDYVFGTKSYYDTATDQITIEPGAKHEYGGIIEEEFKEDIIK